MNNDELFEFQQQLEQAQVEVEKEHQEIIEKKDDYGFAQVLAERQKKKEALKERLVKQNFSEKEIEKLFKIIEKAEDEMEKIKKAYDYKAKIKGASVKMRDDLIAVQNKMKKDFDEEFIKMLKQKKA